MFINKISFPGGKAYEATSIYIINVAVTHWIPVTDLREMAQVADVLWSIFSEK